MIRNTQDLFIASEYPVTSYDLINVVDTLVATFSANSVGSATLLAQNWLKQQTIKNLR
jgi:hypothetical protein